jgi:glucose-1-phosphate thymidylyltransferase
MKGIILAGGRGSRLYPITLSVSKQLLPVYNKPMIYYPLSMLMLAGIREILVISTPEDLPLFKRLLGSGAQWGLHFEYKEQDEPRGLPDAFLIGKDFIQGEPVCLILGDNIFYGTGLVSELESFSKISQGAAIFAYSVVDPQRYGVIELDENEHVISLEEKPVKPRSKYAVPGIYFFDGQVSNLVSALKPSSRSELEIIDLLHFYLVQKNLRAKILGRGVAWLDAGTHESLLQAANFVQTVEQRQGLMISCPEEIAYHLGYIDRRQLIRLADQMKSNSYGAYLLSLADE